MLYDLTPGQIVETDRVLSETDVEKARGQLEKGDTLEKVAKRLGGHVWTPPDPRGDEADDPHILIRQSDLLELLDRLGLEGADRDGELVRLLHRGHGPRDS